MNQNTKVGNNTAGTQTTMVPAGSNNKLVAWFVIGLVVGFLVGYFWIGGNSGNNSIVDDTISDTNGIDGVAGGSTTTPSEVRFGKNAILVANQAPGNQVTIDKIEFENPGFVLIHKQENGKPGKMIGYKLFPKGVSEGNIVLSEATQNGQTYYAEVHDDDGDGLFQAGIDVGIPTTNNQTLHTTFKVGNEY